MITLQRIERTFSPFEAAHISGVPVQMLTRTEYSLHEVISLTAAFPLLTPGTSLEAAQRATGIAVLPVLGRLMTLGIATAYEGAWTEAEKRWARNSCVRGVEDDPETSVVIPTGDVIPTAFRGTEDLEESAETEAYRQGLYYWVSLNHEQIAQRVATNANGPVITFTAA